MATEQIMSCGTLLTRCPTCHDDYDPERHEAACPHRYVYWERLLASRTRLVQEIVAAVKRG